MGALLVVELVDQLGRSFGLLQAHGVVEHPHQLDGRNQVSVFHQMVDGLTDRVPVIVSQSIQDGDGILDAVCLFLNGGLQDDPHGFHGPGPHVAEHRDDQVDDHQQVFQLLDHGLLHFKLL